MNEICQRKEAARETPAGETEERAFVVFLPKWMFSMMRNLAPARY
jgi:hypothetical protein